MREVELPEFAGDLWQPFRHLAWHGGRGPGKTRTVASGLILQAMERHERVLCGRETQRSIRDSSKRVLDDEIDRLGVRAAFESTETEIRGPHDSLFLFNGVRGNATGLKSIEGVTTFWGDEAQAFSQGSIETIIPTIRKPNSRLIWTWNPDLPSDPVDQMFRGNDPKVDKWAGPPPDSIVREVNYPDNPWFPDVLRVAMEHDRARDPDKYNHIWLGQYRASSEARVFRNWRIEDFPSPDNVEYRLGADFGFSIDPSCAVRCWIDGTQLFVDHEAWGLHVEVVDLPKLFLTIPDAEKFWLTADSARPETISHLRKNGFPRIAPALKGARSLEEGVEFLKGYDMVVHPRCQHLLDELTHYAYRTDPLTGQVLGVLEDKNNHCIAEGQRVLCRRGLVPIEAVTLADEVCTRAGWKPLTFAGQTDANRQIVEIDTGERVLRCTPDHEVWIVGKGMARADALRYGDELLMEVSAPWQRAKKSSGMGSAIAAIQTASAQATEAISGGLAQASRRCSTAMFGSTIMARFRRAITSTTSTATLRTTPLGTWSASPLPFTCPSTAKVGHPNERRGKQRTLTALETRPRNGMDRKPDARSIAKLGLSPISSSSPFQSRASIAGRCLSLASSAISTVFARTSASRLRGGPAARITNNASAPNVGPVSASTAIANPALVPVRVRTVRAVGRSERVYDLTVADQHEFVVEGLLVSNCIDALRYAVEGARRALSAKPRVVAVVVPTVATSFNRKRP